MVNFQGLFKTNLNSRPFQGTPPNSRPFQACANPGLIIIIIFNEEIYTEIDKPVSLVIHKHTFTSVSLSSVKSIIDPAMFSCFV